MKKLLIFNLVLVVFGVIKLQAQTTGSEILEGGKVVLEFVKIFSPDKDKTTKRPSFGDCNKDKASDLSYINKRANSIKIILEDRMDASKKYELIVQPGQKEAILHIPASIYHCTVLDFNNNGVLRKGDIRLEKCENPTIEIN